jgi:SpoVK/Ycf46/Vps4 family AAA+-type ATPase
MKGKGKVKTFILRTKKSSRKTRQTYTGMLTSINPSSSQDIRNQYSNKKKDSLANFAQIRPNSRSELNLEDSDEDVSQMINMSFDQNDLNQSLNQSLEHNQNEDIKPSRTKN